MGKRVVGPSPPEPNWDRLDFRGVNSTRNAWGYLAPDDSAIVSDDGKVFIRVDKTMVEKPKSGKGVLVRLLASQAAVLKRCLRWAKIIKELYDFEQEVEDDISTDVGERWTTWRWFCHRQRKNRASTHAARPQAQVVHASFQVLNPITVKGNLQRSSALWHKRVAG